MTFQKRIKVDWISEEPLFAPETVDAVQKCSLSIKITMVHGSKDEVVPVSFSRKVLSVFPNAQKKLVVIKNGDHSLSNQAPLKKIIKELKSIVEDII